MAKAAGRRCAFSKLTVCCNSASFALAKEKKSLDLGLLRGVAAHILRNLLESVLRSRNTSRVGIEVAYL
jgi:hypothetical protein